MTGEEIKTTSKKSKKGIIIIVIIVVVLVGLVLIGQYISKMVAQKASSAFLSGVTGQNVNVSGGENVTIKTGDGEVNINSDGKVPDSFPKDFPIYPNSKVTGSFSTNGKDDTKGSSVVWESSDTTAKVSEFYKNELPKAGYTIVTDYTSGDTMTLTFEKSGTSGFIGVGSSDEAKDCNLCNSWS